MLATFGDGQVFWALLVFFFWIIWIWLLIMVFSDLFRSGDLSGWGKAAWALGILVLPYLGVFLYLIFRGGKMDERALASAQAQDAAFRQYVKGEAAATKGDGAKPADELAKLEDLKRRGVISDAEFDQLKAKVVSG
ncbi:MAG: SHOCT domain-containing protein [Actinobacteria bacterium]|nr:MAG: SHOCT domain-containing protein [Actinomycetota bacterium]